MRWRQGSPPWPAKRRRSLEKSSPTMAPTLDAAVTKRRARDGHHQHSRFVYGSHREPHYKRAYPSVRVISGGVFPFTAGLLVRDKSDIKRVSDPGKRMAWDFGGHAINQTWQDAMMEMEEVKPTDVTRLPPISMMESAESSKEK